MERREFIKAGSLAALSMAIAPKLRARATQMIGIQIGAPSFVDEGIEPCLDNLQQLAGVNTLFAVLYSYKQGLSGRTWPPVDHGLQQKGAEFHGGYYANVHPEYYHGTLFEGNARLLRAPDHGDFDLLGSVLPAAKKRGLKTIVWIADQIHDEIQPFKEMCEVDLNGHTLDQVCFNNPHFRAFLAAMVKDCVQSYEIDGLLWRSERWGALTNTLRWDGRKKTEIPCFCRFCLEKATASGINTERARAGYQALCAFTQQARSQKKPPQGFYAAFWRILLRYPEILAWDMFWYDSLREIYKLVYTTAKNLKADLLVGSAIPHSISFNPFYRAVVDLQELARYNDFLKIIAYHTDGGPRCAGYVDGLFGTYLSDLPRDERLSFLYRIMGYSESDYETIAARGFSADYVFRESSAWQQEAEGTKMQIWPGIDIDVSPEKGDDPPRSRESVREAVLAAFRAGVPGVVLARMYSEMQLEHLRGAGDAVRQLGI